LSLLDIVSISAVVVFLIFSLLSSKGRSLRLSLLWPIIILALTSTVWRIVSSVGVYINTEWMIAHWAELSTYFGFFTALLLYFWAIMYLYAREAYRVSRVGVLLFAVGIFLNNLVKAVNDFSFPVSREAAVAVWGEALDLPLAGYSYINADTAFGFLGDIFPTFPGMETRGSVSSVGDIFVLLSLILLVSTAVIFFAKEKLPRSS